MRAGVAIEVKIGDKKAQGFENSFVHRFKVYLKAEVRSRVAHYGCQK